ncbi:MAG: BrnA antitoxin family protein [Xanthomonadales bacterium]|nr:BrnA antitoxin family protein [Xanthomonadales bacterium]
MQKEYDFSRARRAKDIPHLAKLQAEAKGKTRVTIMLDNFVIEAFRELAKAEGIGYQTLINRSLRECLVDGPVNEETLRRVIREEFGTCHSEKGGY